MNGLKPFRNIPKDIVEWTRWMRDQDGSLRAFINSIIDDADLGSTTTIVGDGDHTHRWTVESFDGDYTLTSEDPGKLLYSESASACSFNVPSGVFEIGDQVTVAQYGAGTMTVVAGTGVTINTPNALILLSQHATATLILLNNDDWVVAGRI